VIEKPMAIKKDYSMEISKVIAMATLTATLTGIQKLTVTVTETSMVI